MQFSGLFSRCFLHKRNSFLCWSFLKNKCNSFLFFFALLYTLHKLSNIIILFSLLYSVFIHNKQLVQVSITFFHDFTNNLNHFSESVSAEVLNDLLDGVVYNPGGTLIGQALEYVNSFVFNSNNGDRPTVPDVLILMTDGESFDDVTTGANVSLNWVKMTSAIRKTDNFEYFGLEGINTRSKYFR